MTAVGVELHGIKTEWSKEEVRNRLWNLSKLSGKEGTGKCIDWKLPFPGDVQVTQVSKEQQKAILNQLAAQVLKTDDKDLISVFRRAVRVHDTINEEDKVDPVAMFNKHHKASDYEIPKTDLTLDIHEDHVLVTTNLSIARKNNAPHLVLDGRDHDVQEVIVNGKKLSQEEFSVTPHELIIHTAPEEKEFTVQVKSKIDPFNNKSLEGLYTSGKWLTTQCESEGARRIFFTIDRPEVLSSYTTTIIADNKKYEHRISNGNLVYEGIAEDGRAKVTWKDPFPKPSYLFATVLGDFAVLEDTYITRSGKDVKLQLYVEKGKEKRAEFAMHCLKKSMQFDEEFFDREYDLDVLKVVGIPNFTAGAMENKGLLIFNDKDLLVDPETGTDANYRRIAHVVFHEYAHNWSGNRVTVFNWFELALKEAFTDFRSLLFLVWLFSEEFERIEQIKKLRDGQFPDDAGPSAHPIVVKSFINSGDIYDYTTYVKGREVFRTLCNVLDAFKTEEFRKVQNEYFKRFDGKAVTFKDLLKVANEVSGVDISVFENWFHQAGTPVVSVEMDYDSNAKVAKIKVKQSCPSPISGDEQKPFHIPFPLELLGPNGETYLPKFNFEIKTAENVFTIEDVPERPTPVFLHGLSAPVKYNYDYTDQDLTNIIYNCNDPFWKWEAGQIFAKRQIGAFIEELKKGPQANPKISVDVVSAYAKALSSEELSPLVKAQLLDFPTVRALTEGLEEYDFPLISKALGMFKQQLGGQLEGLLLDLLEKNPNPEKYDPYAENFPETMKVRALRNNCLDLLVASNPKKHMDRVVEQYQTANNFNNKKKALELLVDSEDDRKVEVLKGFYEKWKGDTIMFMEWIEAQSGAGSCTIETLNSILAFAGKGYDPDNPNHVRSVFRKFVGNLGAYHDPEGKGYQFITENVIAISKVNVQLAVSYIAGEAYGDYAKLPAKQKALMKKQLERIYEDSSLNPRLRNVAKQHLTGN